VSAAGYSGTLLPRKLGITEGACVAFVNAPEGFTKLLGRLPADVDVRKQARGRLDVVVLFTKRRAELERRVGALAAAIEPAGGLWVSWPKCASGIETDMSEDVVRDVALPLGLVDNKVCAIDDTWSGLRVVWRKERRAVPKQSTTKKTTKNAKKARQ
jgi:hypothetical protein